MHYIFGGGNDSHCLPEILNEEKFDNLPHVRDLISYQIFSIFYKLIENVNLRAIDHYKHWVPIDNAQP